MTRRELVAFVMEAVNRRDFDGVAAVTHPDLEFHSIVSIADGGVYRGVDGLREWGAMADDMWSDFRVDVLEVIEGTEDRVVAFLRLTGTARSSGVPLDVRVAQVWEWKDGVLWRNTAYSDHDEALRAAGAGR